MNARHREDIDELEKLEQAYEASLKDKVGKSEKRFGAILKKKRKKKKKHSPSKKKKKKKNIQKAKPLNFS
jgi:hypothetical protein